MQRILRHVWSKRDRKKKNLKYESIERLKKRNSEIRQGKPEGGKREILWRASGSLSSHSLMPGAELWSHRLCTAVNCRQKLAQRFGLQPSVCLDWNEVCRRGASPLSKHNLVSGVSYVLTWAKSKLQIHFTRSDGNISQSLMQSSITQRNGSCNTLGICMKNVRFSILLKRVLIMEIIYF